MQIFIDVLKRSGLSRTGPRLEVFMALYAYGLQTMSELMNRCPNSNRASIYRSVETLEKIGVIRRIPMGFRYKLELSDPYLPHHHHITCTVCGATREIQQSSLESLLEQLASQNGFHLTSHRVELSGTCTSCTSRLQHPLPRI